MNLKKFLEFVTRFVASQFAGICCTQGRDENISKNGHRQRRPEKLCGRRRPVEKLSLVDVDQENVSGRHQPVEKLSGQRRPVENVSRKRGRRLTVDG